MKFIEKLLMDESKDKSIILSKINDIVKTLNKEISALPKSKEYSSVIMDIKYDLKSAISNLELLKRNLNRI